MTRRPNQARPEEAHAAMNRVFGVNVEAEAAPSSSTAPEPPAEEAEGRVALGRVFGTEA
ncbi:MAG TPA: hypothetical protein VHS79_04700 [Actinomycetes bacterium]|jgi:hypothetical protein|nr:hypothetical protein [Actinomycetota bacterium]HEX2156270.1 hypothetical protein [Actinomycetes bacterium]